jgi:hypothetical protein
MGLWEAFDLCAKDRKFVFVLDAARWLRTEVKGTTARENQELFWTGRRRVQNLKIIITSRPWSSPIGNGSFYQSGLNKEAIQLMGENDKEERQISAQIEFVIRARVLGSRDIRRDKGESNVWEFASKHLWVEPSWCYQVLTMIPTACSKHAGIQYLIVHICE